MSHSNRQFGDARIPDAAAKHDTVGRIAVADVARIHVEFAAVDDIDRDSARRVAADDLAFGNHDVVGSGRARPVRAGESEPDEILGKIEAGEDIRPRRFVGRIVATEPNTKVKVVDAQTGELGSGEPPKIAREIILGARDEAHRLDKDVFVTARGDARSHDPACRVADEFHPMFPVADENAFVGEIDRGVDLVGAVEEKDLDFAGAERGVDVGLVVDPIADDIGGGFVGGGRIDSGNLDHSGPPLNETDHTHDIRRP